MTTKSTCKKLLCAAGLMASLAISNSAYSNIINANFNDNLNGWGGDVTYYDVNNDEDLNALDVNFNNFTDNFSTSANSVTLTTSADANTENWGVYLFQEFMVNADSLELSLSFESAADYAYVTLVDENLDLIHDFMNDGLSYDISSFAGSLVSLEFGIEDTDFVYDDYLTVSNISISQQPLPVPEPSSLLLLSLAFIGLKLRAFLNK